MKKWWLSKTFWLNLIIAALAGFWPSARDFVSAHPDYVVYGWSAVNVLLRAISKDKLVLTE